MNDESNLEPHSPPAVDTTCKRCGTVNEPDTNRCRNCNAFLPMHRSNESHAIHTLQRRGVGALPPEFQVMKCERQEQMLIDLGGRDQLSALEVGLVERAAYLATMLDLYEADFQARGFYTPRGRQRNSVEAYLKILDRYEKLAKRLGLQRRTKDVNPIDDYLKRRQKERDEAQSEKCDV